MEKNYKRVKTACYISNIGGALVCNLPPLLFLTFRSLYGISYSLLGLLILINFCTQLGVDLIFSFFSHRFNISKAVKLLPIMTASGFFVYGIYPFLFPDSVYIGLVIGTFLFSISGGLVEVLLTPVVGAIPSDNSERDLSKLHSFYAWGAVGIVIISTLFLKLFGAKNWQWLVFTFLIIPISASIVFSGCKIPDIATHKNASGAFNFLKNKGIWLCFAGIFLGGASEVTMSQWSSTYLEIALGIPKAWGDIFGVALFAAMLGVGRTLYAKYGKNIERVLVWSAVGATICYFVTVISSNQLLGLLACVMTGFFTSMMWPGSLIVVSNRYPEGNVMIFALMAAGGDLGASVVPQIIGIVADLFTTNQAFLSVAQNIGIMPEQLGLKTGMLIGMLFPLMGLFVYSKIKNQKE